MKTQRKCKNCNSFISAKLRADAKYCNEQCRIEYNAKQKGKKRMKLKSTQEVVSVDKTEIKNEDNYFMLKEIDRKLSKIANLLEAQTVLNERYLTPAQVMDELSINRTTFNRYTKDGIFKVYKLTDRKMYCKKSEITGLLK